MMQTLNVLSIDVEDWFHVLDSPVVPEMEQWNSMKSCIEAGMEKILILFAEHNVKATFFWLGWSAEKYPNLVRGCAEAGHEIACHGYNHAPAREGGREVFVEEVCRGKKVLEDIIGHKVVGFRAPGFITKTNLEWVFEEIQAAGYHYDSSVFPTTNRFGSINTVPVGPCFIETQRGMLLEIPMSVVEIFGRRFSVFGGGYLRLAPKFMIEWGVKKLHAKSLPLIVYVHPRELDPDYPRLPLSLIQRFKCYVNLKTTMPKLRWLCENYSFCAMRTMLKVFPDSFSSKKNGNEIPIVRLQDTDSGSTDSCHPMSSALRSNTTLSHKNKVTPQRPQSLIDDVEFDLIDYDGVFRIISQWRKHDERHYITLSNPYTVTLCHQDEKLQRATEQASLTLPDGIGIICAANLLGHKHRGRVTGPMLMLKLCDWSRKAKFRHFFYGGTEGVANRLSARLSSKYPGLQVAGTYCPPFGQLSKEEDGEVINTINATRPDILWVGLGAPKQEKWMLDHLGKINTAVMIGVGAAFDFHSGTVKWAPRWLRQLGLEGVHRTIQEPKRMFPRILGDISFAIRVFSKSIRDIVSKRKT